MRLVIAAALAAAMASPSLAQGGPAAADRQYQNTVGAPQKATGWTPPPAAPPPPAPAAAPAQQPVIKKGPPCGSVPPKAAATPMGGGGGYPCIRR